MRFLLFLSVSLCLSGSFAAAGPLAMAASPVLRDVEVSGRPSGARAVAASAAQSWVGRPLGPNGLEPLVAAVGRALVAEGWGIGTVEAVLDTLEEGPVCRIRLAGIEPTRLSRWSWDPATGREAPEPGLWVPRRRQQDLELLIEKVQEEGYPFASVQILEAAQTEEGLAVRARLREGPRLVLAGVRFEGQGATRPAYLERVSRLKRGEPIRPGEAARARDRLERTGLFAEVRGPWLRAAGEGRATLLYRLKAFPQNRVEGAIGYEGKSRTLSGTIDVELGNLFGTGRQLRAAWERIDRDRSQLDLAYREPFLAGLPLSAEVRLFQYLEDSTWTQDEMRGLLDAALGGGWSARAGLAWERTVFSGQPSGRTRRVATILGVAVDHRSEGGTRGERFDLEVDTGSLETSPRAAEGEGRLAIVRFLGERNVTFGGQGQLRVELQGGWVTGPDSLPRPRAVAVGGGASLRGFAERAFRVLRVGLIRLEGGVRILPEGNRAYLFVDGAVLRPWPSGANERHLAYGAGARVRSAGGWVRLDYGVPWGEAPLSGRLHFRLERRF